MVANCVLLLATTAVVASAINNRPIVGILTLPNAINTSLGHSYFPASYVKWLEGSGARVVPIYYDAPIATTKALLKSLNGALFTGGAASFFSKGNPTIYANTAMAIFEESVSASANGEVWPLWGTCLGHELVSVLASNFSQDVLTPGWDSENISLTVAWTPDAATSRLFGPVPQVRDVFATQAVAMNAHQQGVSIANFNKEPTFSSRFRVLGTSIDRAGKEFVASIEGIPPLNIWGTQFHPEKTVYEWWASEAMDHSWDSIFANMHTGLFFVNQTRQSDRSFPSPAEEAAALIYTHPPTYTAPFSHGFEQCYFFAKA